MAIPSEQLVEEFSRNGWASIALDAVPRFDGIFHGGFATCAVVLANESSRVVGDWADFQGALAQLRTAGRLDRQKDVYLVFVVDKIETSALGGIQQALDDTRVCRKIVLERKGRSIGDTLNDIPFFSTPGTERPAGEADDGDLSSLREIPAEARRDLERRSAEKVLERLIAGEYEEG